MIKESTMYNMTCDGCGCELDEQYWNDPEVVTDNANEANWKQIDGKDYCPTCYKYDDNDNLITRL